MELYFWEQLQQYWWEDDMSKNSWQDNAQMKDSEMVQKWTNLLHTVEEAVEQLNHQKNSLMEKRENIVKSKDNKNG